MKGNRNIDIAPYPGQSNVREHSNIYFARVIFHEILHHATGKQGRLFSHKDMANAVSKVTGMKPEHTTDDGYSLFASNQIAAHCR